MHNVMVLKLWDQYRLEEIRIFAKNPLFKLLEKHPLIIVLMAPAGHCCMFARVFGQGALHISPCRSISPTYGPQTFWAGVPEIRDCGISVLALVVRSSVGGMPMP